MNVILIAVISLGAIALVAAVIFTWLPRNLPCMKIRELHKWQPCCLRQTAVDVVTRVVADLPMLASRQVRWKVNFVRWADSLS